jgi:hypothetical protein
MKDEKEFLREARDLLESSSENLDSRTRQRMAAIRSKCLGLGEEKPSPFSIPFRWVLAGSSSIAAVVALALFFWLSGSPGEIPVKNIEDFEILTSREQIEIYQNVDFYRWLAIEKNGEGETSEL